MDLIYLAEPTVSAIVQGMMLLRVERIFPSTISKISALSNAIRDLKLGKTICPYECNKRIRGYYNWENVSSRTEIVYRNISDESTQHLGKKLRRYV